jgi:hypothetical protein
MADIAAANVTFTPIAHTEKVVQSRRSGVFTIAFGDGSLTYPALGIPLTAAKVGCPNQIEEFSFVDMAPANGFIYKYDTANNKLRIYQGDSDGVADGPMVELGNVAVAATSLSARIVGW